MVNRGRASALGTLSLLVFASGGQAHAAEYDGGTAQGVVVDAQDTEAACVAITRGDTVHISSTAPLAASGHGWWERGTCQTASLADVTVWLQIYKSGTWVTVGAIGRGRWYPNGGAGHRSTARATWSNSSYSHWRSQVDVDLVGIIDDSSVLTTPDTGRFCGV